MKKYTLAGLGLLLFATQGVGQDIDFEIQHQQKLNNELYQLVYNPVNSLVYVAGPKAGFDKNADNYIYVLDGKNLAVKDSISVGKHRPFGIALNKATQTLYVGHSFDGAISAVDLKSKKQTLIPSGKEKSKIREIVVDEKRNKVYVSDHGNASIWEVDGKTNTYLKSFDSPGAYLIGVNVDSERGNVYGTDGSNMEGNILVFDSETGKLKNKYKSWSYCPMNIALDKSNNRLFVSQSNDNNITVLNGETGDILHKVYLGYDASPIGVLYDPLNNLIYAANRNKNEVAVINAVDYKIVERIPTEGLPNTITLDPATGAIYITNKKAGRNGQPVANANTVMKIVKKQS